MVVQLAGVVGDLFAGNLARHLDVSAQRQRVDLVFRAAAAEAGDALAEADGKGLDPYAAPLGHGEVAGLMHQHHEAKHHEKFKDSGHRCK